LLALMPWSADPRPHDNRPPFPGLHGFIRTLTGGRASVRAVQRWAAGSRPAPVWFRSVLRDQLLVRRAAIDAALEGLASCEFGPGHGHGLRSTGVSDMNAGKQGMVPSIPDKWLAVLLRSLTALARDQEPCRAGSQTWGRRGLGPVKRKRDGLGRFQLRIVVNTAAAAPIGIAAAAATASAPSTASASSPASAAIAASVTSAATG